MKTKLTVVIVVITGLSFLPATAEDNPALHEFQQFMSPFLDGEWSYTTRMTDEAGAVTFEGTDLRRYRRGMRNRYIIEDIYHEDGGEPQHVAVHLIGFDVPSGTIRISLFWPWQGTSIAEVNATIVAGDSGSKKMQFIVSIPGQEFPKTDFTCQFDDAGDYRCEAYATTADGTRYKSNEEVFTRR